MADSLCPTPSIFQRLRTEHFSAVTSDFLKQMIIIKLFNYVVENSFEILSESFLFISFLFFVKTRIREWIPLKFLSVPEIQEDGTS